MADSQIEVRGLTKRYGPVLAVDGLSFGIRSGPAHHRRVLVRHTPAWRALLADALDAMADIEAGYEHLIGPARMRSLKKALADIAQAAGPVSALARR